MRQLFAFLCLLLAGSCVGANQTAAADRVALVIGNSAYTNTDELTNPKYDAQDIAELLSKLGFQVWLGLDLDRRRMEGQIQEFSDSLIGSRIGFFFFAGHGLNINGRNYLLPIDVSFQSERDVERGLVDLDLIKGRMELSAEANIILIDACRDNPLSKRLSDAADKNLKKIGLGLLPRQDIGTIIGYSTQPGSTAEDGDGRNSPYAQALLRHLRTPMIDSATLLARVRHDVAAATRNQQVPWDVSGRAVPIILNIPGESAKQAAAIRDARGGLSDSAVQTLLKYTWAMIPESFTMPNGTTVKFDKQRPEAILPSLDVARDVIFAARRSSYASICKLDATVDRNYQALMSRINGSDSWTPQQFLYLNRLHLMAVMFLTVMSR